ncbi:rhomboid family intramembrane serine protease [Hymenobacter convexus]|uniref:rhomboid family intramembrane serine protease n=1 Tax=Hymenobacter sp. CA1UV-4 TaxID=3063782 RepID=UPI0027122E0B|nr:rhomboid family intramembrane serine protease [Hymenobacter sp. CA1UV-4]MDO7850866.1 rhomboid family intramembrane serine protease [Hymenobacter sp. CA1UV-4]
MFNPILILIGLTVAISVYAWSKQELMDSWIMQPYLMARSSGQWYRLLTSGFLHADWAHLLFNMFAFYSFGPVVLRALVEGYGPLPGIGLFLVLYLGGIILSDLPSYFQHRDDRGYRSLGASGGVASVLFASILLFPVNNNGGGIIIFPIPFPIQPFLFGFLYLAYSYYMARRRADNVNHDAHFYGALYGVVLFLLLMPAAGPAFIEQISLFIKSKF